MKFYGILRTYEDPMDRRYDKEDLDPENFYLDKAKAEMDAAHDNSYDLKSLYKQLEFAKAKDKKDADKYAADKAKLVAAGFSESDQIRLLGADRTWSFTESIQSRIDDYVGEYRVIEIETRD